MIYMGRIASGDPGLISKSLVLMRRKLHGCSGTVEQLIHNQQVKSGTRKPQG